MAAIYLSCSWLLGITLGSVFVLSPVYALPSILPLLLFFVLRRWRRAVILSSLCIVVFVAAAVYSGSAHHLPAAPHLCSYNGTGIMELKGIVSREPEYSPKTARICLSVSEVKADGTWHHTYGTALLYTSRYPEYYYGDVLLVKGVLEGKPDLQERMALSSTDDASYWVNLTNQDIYSTVSYPRIDIIARGKGVLLLHWLYAVRNNLSQTIARVLPEPHAALAQGITLGIRENIPRTLEADFVSTGTAHLLAISGVNLMIIAGMLVSFTIWLFGKQRYIYIWVTLLVVWLYTWLTGLNPPVLRAAVMLSFFLAADIAGRQRSSVIALVLAAALMTAISPKALSDVSFQLSFVAMAGLVFLCPPMQSLSRTALERITPDGRIRSAATVITDSFSVSLGAVITTWPLTAYHFGIVSWIGPVATFVTLPSMSAIIVTGVVAGAVGVVLPSVAQVVAWIAWLPLSYLVTAVTVFASIPWASMGSGLIPPTAIAAYYVALVFGLLSLRYRRALTSAVTQIAGFVLHLPKKWTVTPLLLITMLAWLFFATMPDDRLHVSFLDVGQGDAILIEKGLQQILVDGGPDTQAVVYAISKKMPFWDRTLDAVILTHPDTDHLSGLVGILARYRVLHVFSANLSDDTPLFREWANMIDAHDIEQTLVREGRVVILGADVLLEVLNPTGGVGSDGSTDINDVSVVMRVRMGKVSFLLTGDISNQAEIDLVSQRANLHSTILKVAHHGSGYSTGDGFLSVVDPRIAVISVGENNAYGHPDKKVVNRLIQHVGEDNIYRTDEDGTIEFITDGEKLWVRTGN